MYPNSIEKKTIIETRYTQCERTLVEKEDISSQY